MKLEDLGEEVDCLERRRETLMHLTPVFVYGQKGLTVKRVEGCEMPYPIMYNTNEKCGVGKGRQSIPCVISNLKVPSRVSSSPKS